MHENFTFQSDHVIVQAFGEKKEKRKKKIRGVWDLQFQYKFSFLLGIIGIFL